MVTLEQIQKPIESDLRLFDSFVGEQFKCDDDVLAPMLRDALSSRGKGVRPLLVMLSAGLNSKAGVVSRRAWVAALMVEMIHLASLIHDDVIDESPMRRGKPSLNALWQSKRAVLTGDYILGRSLSIALSIGQYDIVTHITRAISILCEGELLQDDLARKLTMTREGYLQIISKKTASLLAISASAGALAAGASPIEVDRMRSFGEAIGMAFQIQDDILDYSPNAQSGKPVNNDIREGKITLPLLAVMERAPEREREEILKKLASAHEDEGMVEYLQQRVEEGGGVEFARQVMQAYLEKATKILADYPESEFRSALINLALFITERNK